MCIVSECRFVKKKAGDDVKTEKHHENGKENEIESNESGYKTSEKGKKNEDYVEVVQPGTKEPSAYKTIFNAFGWYYILGGFFKLVFDIISFINPQILR